MNHPSPVGRGRHATPLNDSIKSIKFYASPQLRQEIDQVALPNVSGWLRIVALQAAAAQEAGQPWTNVSGSRAAPGELGDRQELEIYLGQSEKARIEAAARQARVTTAKWLRAQVQYALQRPALGLGALSRETSMLTQKKPQATVIALPQNKGGSGKTTTAVNLGAELARRGYTTLILDLDPQSDLSEGLGIETDADAEDADSPIPNRNLYAVLTRKGALADLVVATRWDRLYLVPGTFWMNDLDEGLKGRIGREQVLKRALDPLLGQYDFILLDCPSWMGLITQAAMIAADYILIPVQAAPRSLRASTRTLDIVQEIQQELSDNNQPAPEVLGMVLTMRPPTVVGRAASESLRRRYPDLVLQTEIPQRARVTEDMVHQAPLWTYAPKDAATQAYDQLAAETLARLGLPAQAPLQEEVLAYDR